MIEKEKDTEQVEKPADEVLEDEALDDVSGGNITGRRGGGGRRVPRR